MINVLKGIITAFALLVPGVSGGTMMIVLNVYDQTIAAMSQLISGKLIHKKMMFQLALGGLIGIIFFSSTIQYLITSYPMPMGYLFLGLVLTGIGAFISKINWKQFKISFLLYFSVGLIIAVLTTFFNTDQLINGHVSGIQYLALVIVSGVVIAVALILPGISTSFLLLSLGMYDDTLQAFSTFDLRYIVPLIIGILLGLLLTTKLLEYLLQHHTTPTYLMILGFVLGSVGTIFPGVPVSTQWISSLVMFGLGVILMIFIQWLVVKYPSQSD